jgi:hypothetical protein
VGGFTLHYFAVNFGMQEPFFSIDSFPVQFGFTQFQIVFLYIATVSGKTLLP